MPPPHSFQEGGGAIKMSKFLLRPPSKASLPCAHERRVLERKLQLYRRLIKKLGARFLRQKARIFHIRIIHLLIAEPRQQMFCVVVKENSLRDILWAFLIYSSFLQRGRGGYSPNRPPLYTSLHMSVTSRFFAPQYGRCH